MHQLTTRLYVSDIDINVDDRNSVFNIIKHVLTSMKDNKTFKKHNTGVYCHSIPYSPLTGLQNKIRKTTPFGVVFLFIH